MALTAEQSALLELLLGGDQSFAELGEMLGLDEDEIRLRAREALGELGGADPDRNVGLSEYLLGRADPIGRADAVRHLRQDPADHAFAAALAERLREIAPDARVPDLPPPPGGVRAPRPARPSAPRVPRPGALPGSLASLSGGRLYAALAAAGVVLIAIVLAVSGVFSGDDESPVATTADGEQPGEVPDEEVERIALDPVGGGDASGEGAIGITTGDQPYLDLRLENLEPAPQGQVYVVWFLFDEQNGYPLSPISPDRQGNFQDRFAVPSAAIAVLQRMRFLNVSLAPVGEVQTAIRKAVREGNIVIRKPGRTVLQNAQPLAAAGGGQAQGGE